jgi:hypothetical protein
MTYIAIILPTIALVFILMNKKGLQWIAEKKGKESLEKLLFSKGSDCKEHVIQTIMEITSKRINEEDALDYFLKIKGLQVINLTHPVGFWTRKYLLANTRVRLSYFEQVKFYEAFLNFSATGCDEKHRNTSQLASFPLTQATQELIRNPALSKSLAFSVE